MRITHKSTNFFKQGLCSLAVPILRVFPLSVIAVVGLVVLFPQITLAQWTNVGNVNGVQVWRDNRTGLEWTATLGTVQASGWGAPARALVAQHGFRLPSLSELQVMGANGGFQPLSLRTAGTQYYETSDSNILGIPRNNSFRSWQRRGVGPSWVVGVRQVVAASSHHGHQPFEAASSFDGTTIETTHSISGQPVPRPIVQSMTPTSPAPQASAPQASVTQPAPVVTTLRPPAAGATNRPSPQATAPSQQRPSPAREPERNTDAEVQRLLQIIERQEALLERLSNERLPTSRPVRPTVTRPTGGSSLALPTVPTYDE